MGRYSHLREQGVLTGSRTLVLRAETFR